MKIGIIAVFRLRKIGSTPNEVEKNAFLEDSWWKERANKTRMRNHLVHGKIKNIIAKYFELYIFIKTKAIQI